MATESELRYNAAHFLDSYKGCVEGGSKHKSLVDMFNNSGKCTRYTVTLKDAWCAVAYCDCFIGTGLTDLIPIDCGCAEMAAKSKEKGIWVEDDAYVPQMGDGILYDWQDTTGSKSDNTGTPDHIGMVQTVNKSAGTFTVIEGNKSDTVGTRTMQINGSYIRGFITPDYASAASSGSTGSGTTSGTTGSGTGSGTTSSDDNNFTYTATLDVDGEIGPKSVMRMQTVMGQKGKKNVDGYIDGQQSASQKYWTSVTSKACGWTGGSSPVVKLMQQYVKDKGFNPGTVDGKLGKKTATAWQNFLISLGFSCGKAGADGKFGSNSAMALQNWLNTK